MPTFRITKDGATYDIQAPDEDQALSALEDVHPSKPVKTSGVDTAADVVKSLGAGVGEGTAGVLGTPGSLQGIGDLMARYAPKLFGGNAIQPDQAAAQDQAYQNAPKFVPRMNPADILNPENIKNGIERFTGAFHQPETTAGKYAKTVGEFLPAAALSPLGANSGLANNVANVAKQAVPAVTAGVGSEAAGQAAQALKPDLEPYARIAGGFAGAMAPSALSRAVTPFPIDQRRQQLVNTLNDAGVDLTAGQVSGNKALLTAESHTQDLPFGGGKASDIFDNQKRQLIEAATSKTGYKNDLMTQGTMDSTSRALQGEYKNLLQAGAEPDTRLGNDILRTARQYDLDKKVSLQNDGFRKDIADLAQLQPGEMNGAKYQDTRSYYGERAKLFEATDPPTAQAYKGLQKALDDAAARQLGPDAAAQLKDLNRRYANYKVLEKAAASSGEQSAYGYMTPNQLRTALTGQGGNARANYARGRQDLAPLSEAANAIMTTPPNSGTPARQAAEKLLGLPGAAIGGAVGLLHGGPMEGLGAAAAGNYIAKSVAPIASGLAGRALMSNKAQAYMKNQVMNNSPVMQSLLAAPNKKALGLLMMADPRIGGLLSKSSK